MKSLALIFIFITCQQAIADFADSNASDTDPVACISSDKQPVTTFSAASTKVMMEPARGQMLCENNCTSCRQCMAYRYSKHKAHSDKDLVN